MKTKLFLIISIFLFSSFSFGENEISVTLSYDARAEIFKILKSNIEQKANPNNQKDANNSSLHFAAWNGDLIKVKDLLKQGSEPNIKNKYGHTPIFNAVFKGHLEIVRHLLEKEADPNVTDGESTPLEWALLVEQEKIAKLLLEKGAKFILEGRSLIHIVAWKGYLDLMIFFISRGVSPNEIDADGDTPLHPAAYEGHLEVVKLLIKNKANVNIVNRDGYTPLDLAYIKGHKAVLLVLEQAGAKRSKDL